MCNLSGWWKRRTGKKKAKEKKVAGKSSRSDDRVASIGPRTEPASPGDGVGALLLVNSISDDGAGSGSCGTDIVFVHGLRGRRVGTWSKDGICWPEHLLRNDLNDIRVIAWGYDASVANAFHAASKESIFGHADTLLEDLARLRVAITRPIIFICHSLGGLVVKEALIKADNYHNHKRHKTLGDIFVHTAGVIFMGTPHRGSHTETYGDLLVKVAKVAFRQPNDQLLETLRPDSHILENQRDQFTTISSRMPIVCIREELATGIGVIVPEASASYDGFNVRRGAIHANHMDMVKFTSSEDPGYERTLGFITELCHAGQAAQQGGEKRENGKGDEKRKAEILRILEFPSMNDRELDIEKAYAGTCGWIMDDEPSNGTSNRGAPRFKSWLQNDESIFWISGKAGCGKSTLMKFVYQHSDTKAALAQWADNKKLITAGYFFLERGSDLQKSREGMIRSILHQILGERRDLIPVAFPAQFGSHVPPTPDAVNSWKSLAAAFNAVLDGLGDSKVCLFVDGLDEYRMLDKYHEYTQEQLDLVFDGAGEDASWGLSDWIVDGHKDIANFVLEFNARPNAKICLSSRELGVFEQKFRSLPRVEVHHYTAAPIKEYSEGRLVQDAPGLSGSDRANFVSLITKKSRGVFLWVRLVVNMLIDGSAAGDSLGELLKTLESLPVRLGGRNGLYMRMMQNVQPCHLPEAARLFQLVRYWDNATDEGYMDIITLFAAQEGHLETEGEGGLRVQKDEIAPETWEGLRQRWTGLQQRLKSRCGGLLEGTEDVQFMHQTAMEFVSRAYLWDHIFPNHMGFVTDSEKQLAILSGLIRRLKCCREVALVARMIQSSEPRGIQSSEPRGIQSSEQSHQARRRVSLRIIESHSTDSTTIVCAMLANCFSVAIRLELVQDTIDNYEQLMDELLITGDYLTRPQGTDSNTTAQPCGKWIAIFLDKQRFKGIDLTPIGPWDLMIGLGLHHYVITKVKGKGIALAQLQHMLWTASVPFKAKWRSFEFERWVQPQPEIVAALFEEGADPNSKLDETDDPDSGSRGMDKRDESAEPPAGFTVWTSLLRNVYQNKFLFAEDRNLRIIIQHFLDNGANRTARFHDIHGIERTVEEVMEVIEELERYWQAT